MPKRNGQRDTQRTETGYEIPVPKREDVMDMLDRAATKREKAAPKRRKARKAR